MNQQHQGYSRAGNQNSPPSSYEGRGGRRRTKESGKKNFKKADGTPTNKPTMMATPVILGAKSVNFIDNSMPMKLWTESPNQQDTTMSNHGPVNQVGTSAPFAPTAHSLAAHPGSLNTFQPKILQPSPNQAQTTNSTHSLPQSPIPASVQILYNAQTSHSIPTISPSQVSSPIPSGRAPQLLQSSGVPPQLKLKSMRAESAKLLNEHLEFCNSEDLSKLLADQTEFTVIGIIGSSFVGKSSILNELAGKNGSNEEDSEVFGVGGEENILYSKHETSGVDICVTPDRFILLDTQPIFSPSILLHLIENQQPFIPEVNSYENFHDLQCLQLGALLFSICHIVVVISDRVDVRLWKFIQSIEMLKLKIPDVSSPAQPNDLGSNASGGNMGSLSSSGTGSSSSQFTAGESGRASNVGLSPSAEEFLPDVVFLQNKMPDQMFNEIEIQKFHNCLNTFFCNSKFRRNGPQSHVQYPLPVKMSGMMENGMNYFLLPNKYSSQAKKRDSAERYSTLFEDFQRQILSLPKRSFSRPLSEKEWFRNSAKIWETIKKSSFMYEYNKTLQKMQLYD